MTEVLLAVLNCDFWNCGTVQRGNGSSSSTEAFSFDALVADPQSGHIVRTGSTCEIEKFITSNTSFRFKIIDGKALLQSNTTPGDPGAPSSPSPVFGCAGFIDSHVHLLYSGRMSFVKSAQTISSNFTTLAQLKTLVGEAIVERDARLQWTFVKDFDENFLYTEQKEKSDGFVDFRSALDEASPSLPVVVDGVSRKQPDKRGAWYTAYINSTVFEYVFGVQDASEKLASAFESCVERSPTTGRLTGVIWSSARTAVINAWKISPGVTELSYETASSLLLSHGVTMCHTTSTPYSSVELEQIGQLQALLKKRCGDEKGIVCPGVRVRYATRLSHVEHLAQACGRLPLAREEDSPETPPPLADVAWTRDPRSARITANGSSSNRGINMYNTPNEYLRIGMGKGFLDGTLGYRSMAASVNYACTFDTGSAAKCGAQALTLTTAVLTERLKAAKALGVQVMCHAMGDLALDQLLTAAREAQIEPVDRLRVEHAQHTRDDQIELLKQLQVIVSAQPLFIETEGPETIEAFPARFVRDTAFQYGKMRRKGVDLCFGSDWEVASPCPLHGVRAAILRQHLPFNFDHGNTEYTQNSVTLATPSPITESIENRVLPEEALTAYTSAGAFAAFDEDHYGYLAEGRAADFVILSHSPLLLLKNVNGGEDDVSSSCFLPKVLLTIVGGRVAYSAL